MNSERFDYFRNKIGYFSQSSRSYFDSSSFTLVNDLVLDTVSNYYKNGGTRPLTGLYPGTSQASLIIEQCRQSMRSFLHVSQGEIFFPPNRSIGIIQILYSLSLKNKISIVPYTGLDHDIWLPVFEFANQNNIVLSPVKVKNELSELTSEIFSCIEHSRDLQNVLILPYTSLGNGLSLTKEFLGNLQKNTNIIIVLDCTFAVGLTKISFSELSADVIVMDSNIGLGGPLGSGILYVNENLIENMHPYTFFGNGSIIKVNSSSYTLDDPPQRLESGINPSILAGLTKSIEIINDLSITAIKQKITFLKEYFFKILAQHPEIQVLGTADKEFYHNIIGFVIPPFNMHELAMYLDEIHSIDIRSGSFCAHQLIDQLYENLQLTNSNFGILQVSFQYYTTEQEIDKLFTGIKEFLSLFL